MVHFTELCPFFSLTDRTKFGKMYQIDAILIGVTTIQAFNGAGTVDLKFEIVFRF